MIVEILNARKVMRVGMVNPFRLNSMETQGFPSTKPPALFCSTGPAVKNLSFYQAQAKGTFNPLPHHETKQL